MDVASFRKDKRVARISSSIKNFSRFLNDVVLCVNEMIFRRCTLRLFFFEREGRISICSIVIKLSDASISFITATRIAEALEQAHDKSQEVRLFFAFFRNCYEFHKIDL